MAQTTKKKVLIALDGSKRSIQTAAYASKLKPLQNMEIKLFHVFDAIPDNYWDMEQKSQISRSFGSLRAWETKRRNDISDHMNQAQQILVKAGFDPESIQIDIQDRKKGIARDIIKEAQRGYELVICRRRGMGAFRTLVVGSVTSKLLDSLSSVSILLAGQITFGNRFLIAVDGSESSVKAVDFAGRFLTGFGYHIHLVHVIRSGVDFLAGTMPMPVYTPEPFLKEALDESKDLLKKAQERLIAAGFKPSQVSTRTITGVTSRASSIAEEAKNGDYSMIIMGRRGMSAVKEFLMGRVTKKVIQIARKHSLLIIT